MSKYSAWQGKWALVTGASSGIGVALARELAAAGVNLILTARRVDRLQSVATELAAEFSIEVRVLPADLNQRAAAEELFAATEGAGLSVDILINNAGLGQYGRFLDGKLDQELSIVEVNCTSVVHLTRLFVPKMVERKQGWVLVLASTASFQPVPYMATYAASKAFDRFFAEALAAEVERYGVRVTALCPGPTQSEFFLVAGSRELDRSTKKQPTVEVARIGIAALYGGRRAVIPYLGGKLMTVMQRLLPRKLVVQTAEKMFRPPTV
jgi:hypothetical protein